MDMPPPPAPVPYVIAEIDHLSVYLINHNHSYKRYYQIHIKNKQQIEIVTLNMIYKGMLPCFFQGLVFCLV